MAAKSRGVLVVLAVLAVVIILGAVSAGLYLTGVFPAFNEMVRQILWTDMVREVEVQAQQEETLREQTSIHGLHPHLFLLNGTDQIPEIQALDAGGQSASPAGFPPPYFSPDPYSLQLLKDAGEGSSGQPLWTYRNEYPLVSPPGDFFDAVVFIDAQPSLVCLDKATGTELFRIPCQVYPGTEGVAHLKSYFFMSKNGNWYEIRFEEGLTPPEILAVAQPVGEDENLEEEFYRTLLPGKNTLDFVNAKMNGLLSVSPAATVSDTLLYRPDEEPVAFRRDVLSPAFVFSPQEQGTYTLGICDEEGLWVRDNAFVVLYTMSGEALSISLDYVADRPQITTHLSDQELYLACAGFFPDSMILGDGPSQDFRDSPPLPEDAVSGEEPLLVEDDAPPPQAWFQVRRTP